MDMHTKGQDFEGNRIKTRIIIVLERIQICLILK